MLLRRDYELTQLETGLSGNFLVRDYKKYGFLATKGWVKVLWQYCYYYGVQIEVEGMDIPQPRERDFPVMEKFLCLFEQPELEQLNRVRHYKKAYWASQLLEANGWSVRTNALGRSPGTTTTMDFPVQQPTSGDFALWETALRAITSPSLELSPALGKILYDGFDKVVWWKGLSSEYVYRSEEGLRVKKYRVDNNRRSTRSTTALVEDSSSTCDPPRTKYKLVSVYETSSSVQYHSECLYKQFPEESNRSLVDKMQEPPYGSLFQTIHIPQGGDWIVEAIQHGTLMAVHDGSYQPDLDPTVCSAALAIGCSATGRRGVISMAEKTDKHTASNYRGEALGALLHAALMHVCTQDDTSTFQPVRVGCDNMGIVKHARDYKLALPDKQKQADVIRSMRAVIARLPMALNYEHVYAHQDESRGAEDLDDMEQLNVIADRIADNQLVHSVAHNEFVTSNFPDEGIRILCNGKKVTAGVRQSIYDEWGQRVAQELMKERGIADEHSFNLIAWDAVEDAMASFSTGFSTFVTKFVSHFGGTKKMLGNWQDTNKSCPSCGQPNEDMSHITRCQEEGRAQMRTESAHVVAQWLLDTHMDEELVEGFMDYIIAGGTKQLVQILDEDSDYLDYAEEHDRLGWDCFLEGRISHSLLDIQRDCLHRAGAYMTIKTWSKQFIHHMLCVTHRQWTYRNARTHLKKIEGRTQEDHDRVRNEVRALLAVQPEDLLPTHRHLLQFDAEALGQGSTRDRLLWLNQMESAREAKLAASRRQKQKEKDRRNTSSRRDEEGGLEDRERSNLSKRQREGTSLANRSSSELNNG